MESVFSHQKVNLGRQLELDVARTLAVVFMVLVHVITHIVEYPLPENASTHINFVVRLPRRRIHVAVGSWYRLFKKDFCLLFI